MKRVAKSEKDKLNRLVDSVIDDIQEMPDEEVSQLAIEVFGGIEPVINNFNSIVERAEKVAKKQRYDDAKNRLKATHGSSHSANIVNLPLDRKKAILEIVQKNRLISTRAARSATDIEADIDSTLEDLVELGAIDENGNPL